MSALTLWNGSGTYFPASVCLNSSVWCLLSTFNAADTHAPGRLQQLKKIIQATISLFHLHNHALYRKLIYVRKLKFATLQKQVMHLDKETFFTLDLFLLLTFILS